MSRFIHFITEVKPKLALVSVSSSGRIKMDQLDFLYTVAPAWGKVDLIHAKILTVLVELSLKQFTCHKTNHNKESKTLLSSPRCVILPEKLSTINRIKAIGKHPKQIHIGVIRRDKIC